MPLLGQIPMVESLRTGGDIGVPAALEAEGLVAEAYLNLAGEVARQVSMQNSRTFDTVIS